MRARRARATLPRGVLARFARCGSGVSAIEFALVVPVLLLILLGGYTYGQLVAVNRKLTITTRSLVDLTTHYASLTSTQLSAIMAASTQVLSPFSGSPLSITLSEVYIGVAGVGTVVWSQANANGTALTAGAIVVLPSGVGVANSYVVWAQVGYTFTPTLTYVLKASVPLADQLFMSPRRSASIAYSS